MPAGRGGSDMPVGEYMLAREGEMCERQRGREMQLPAGNVRAPVTSEK